MSRSNINNLTRKDFIKLSTSTAAITAIYNTALMAKKEKKNKKSKEQQAIDKYNKVHEVDQKVLKDATEIAKGLKPGIIPKKARKLLVYGVSPGPHRFGLPTYKAVLEMFGKETGIYKAVVSDDLANFEPEALKGFDAVCFSNTTGDVFKRPVAKHLYNKLSNEEKKEQEKNANRLANNLIDYVKNGGGFFGIHAATDSNKKIPAYGEMIGGYFDGHPWGAKSNVTVRIEEPEHFLCKNIFLENDFSITDEIYQFKEPYSRDKVRVLLSIDLDKSDKPGHELKREDRDYPVSWIKKFGKGRMFYCSLGHRVETFSNPLILKYWMGAFQYVLGDKSDD